MAKKCNQKMKILHLAQIFLKETDESHPLTIKEIIAKLELLDISADRKTLYQDFDELRDFGYDIISEQKGRNFYYYLGSRDFELPELKLLVDSVQSAKFITDKKSLQLIKKLESIPNKGAINKARRRAIQAQIDALTGV